MPNGRKVPVENNAAAVEPDANFAARDCFVADLERHTLLEVSRNFADLDLADEGKGDFHDDLDSEIDLIVVDDDLTKR